MSTVKDVLVSLISAALGAGAAIYATTSGSFDRNRELDIKMLELSLAILREDPAKSQIKAARGWAVDLINKVSPVPIPADARAELIENIVWGTEYFTFTPDERWGPVIRRKKVDTKKKEEKAPIDPQ